MTTIADTEKPNLDIDEANPRITIDHYKMIKIPKKKVIGGVEKITGWRIIHEPCPQLKRMQSNLLDELQHINGVKTSYVSHAFTLNKSIVTMAAPHVAARMLVRVDIKDFFPSITPAMLKIAMIKAGYSSEIIKRVLTLCTLEGSLPQGAPTSPFLSNIVGRLIDGRMLGLAKKWRHAQFTKPFNHHRGRPRFKTRIETITYTRYADDLVFSSDYPYLHQIRFAVTHILTTMGFRVNEKKIICSKSPKRLEVCGVVVNEKLSKSREYRRTLRAKIHNIWKQTSDTNIPLGKWVDKDGKIDDIKLDSLRGQVEHIRYVCAHQADQYARKIHEIQDKIRPISPVVVELK